MATKGMEARLAAAALLHGVLFEKRTLSEQTQRRDSNFAKLKPAEKARAQSLATGVLRHLEPLDQVIDRFLNKPTPLKLRNALRMAAAEILVDGIADHAAVDAAVEVTRAAQKTAHLTGLTNAVARKIAQEGPALWQDHTVQKLAPWLAKPVVKNYGKDALEGIEMAHARGAPLDLTFKDTATRDVFAAKIDSTVLPTGSLRLHGNHQISALPGYDAGDWWVQDAAATVPIKLLGKISGKNVLDLCAAPGGKTLQLATAGAQVTAVDASDFRLKRLHENLNRTGLAADVVSADILNWSPDHQFDAVLLDAPCSATGTIRRHPDLPFAKMGVDLAPLFELQSAMIDKALSFLKPGGNMVYCTCSLLPREGERQITDALQRHADVSVRAEDPAEMGLNANWRTAEDGLRLRPDYWPDLGGMDGFYIAVLTKT